MKKRIIFVDDEEMVLQGLQRMLRPYRNEWNMVFVDSGAKALEAMDREPFDVIVADMRMPVMTGAELLNEVMKRHPETVRLILSGHSDKEMIFKSMGVTHQYLAKPCDPETLRSVIQRATASREILHNQELQLLIGQIESLPSLPSLYYEIMDKLNNSDIQLKDITDIISRDLGMTAKILQLVNSAFFGLHTHVSDLNTAVSFLGLNIITALFMTVHTFSACECIQIPELSMTNLWNHSLKTALLAQKICRAEAADQTITNDAFVAGILHDAGQLVLAANFCDRYQEVIRLAKEKHCTIVEAEKRIFDHTHSTIGGYMLCLWGLPVPVVDAVYFHHNPGLASDQTFCALTAVHVANALADSSFGKNEKITANQIDQDYLKSLNMLDHLPAWQNIASNFDYIIVPS
jgi:HD-like signal output (HDOD) protein/CheY-like chemotaxis protein